MNSPTADLAAGISARLSRLVIPNAEAERRRQREFDNAQRQRASELWIQSEVPRRHAQCALAPPPIDPTHPWIGTRARVLESLGGGVMLCLTGPRGNGKTQIAVDAILELTRAGRPALFRTAHRMFMEIKASYASGDRRSELQVLDTLRRPGLLVIDEIGQRAESEWENQTLFAILNERYNDLTDTLLTCNLGLTELKANLGPSLVSRMQEDGGIIECPWPSFRL